MSVEVIGGVVTAGLLAVVLRPREIASAVIEHDRLVAGMNEDLRRWLRDRDHELTGQLSASASELAARGLTYSGANLNAQMAIKKQALKEWRDEATRKMRAYGAVMGGEGISHKLLRKQRDLSPRRLEIPDDGREILERWRAGATIPGGADRHPFDDPTSPEPMVRRFEQTGIGPDDISGPPLMGVMVAERSRSMRSNERNGRKARAL